MSMFKLYLLFTVVPSFSGFFTFIAVMQVLGIIGASLVLDDYLKEFFIEHKKRMKIFLAFFATSVMLANLLPDQKTIIKMYVANYVTTNSQIKQLPKVVVEYLKKETKENE